MGLGWGGMIIFKEVILFFLVINSIFFFNINNMSGKQT